MEEGHDREIYPWRDVLASRRDEALQARASATEARSRYGAVARACPECATPPTHLSWFYFRSPRSTWEHLCGVAGWITVCDWCERQVDFFLESMN